VVGGDLLVGSGAGTKEDTQVVVAATEFTNRSWALKVAHRTVAAFDATMILLRIHSARTAEVAAVASCSAFAVAFHDGRRDRLSIGSQKGL
jgi:hypothetical protein